MSSNQQNIVSLIKRISGQANVLTIPRVYIDLLDGDVHAALMLSQIIYWSDRTKKTDGWFYKKTEEWTDEIGLSRYQIDRVLKVLPWVDTKVVQVAGAPVKHYRIDLDALADSICKKLTNPNDRFVRNSQNGFVRNSQMDLQETYKSLNIESETTYIDHTESSIPPASREETETSEAAPAIENPENDLATAWRRVELQLRMNTPRHLFDAWLASLRPVDLVDGVLQLRAMNHVAAKKALELAKQAGVEIDVIL